LRRRKGSYRPSPERDPPAAARRPRIAVPVPATGLQPSSQDDDDEQERSGDDLRTGAHVEQADQEDQAREDQQEAGVDDAPRVGVRRELRDPRGEQQQRQRQRQEPHAGLDGALKCS
jgi:hypothetical protein